LSLNFDSLLSRKAKRNLWEEFNVDILSNDNKKDGQDCVLASSLSTTSLYPYSISHPPHQLSVIHVQLCRCRYPCCVLCLYCTTCTGITRYWIWRLQTRSETPRHGTRTLNPFLTALTITDNSNTLTHITRCTYQTFPFYQF